MNFYVATPGPTNIPQEVFDAMHCNVHHRVSEFEEIFGACTTRLAPFFGCPNRPIIISGSGTSIMETAVINSLSSGDTVISLEFGKFSERFGDIATEHGCNVIRISTPYGTSPSVDMLAKALKDHPQTKAVLTCHCETSTGVLAPIEEYAKLIADTDMLFIVDCISSVGSIKIDQAKNKIDICLSSGNKGFMTPPGLGIISYYGDKILKAFANSNIPKFYNKLSQEIIYQSRNEVRWTPSIQIICGLNKSLEILTDIGVDANIAKHQQIAEYAHQRIQSWGLQSVVKEGFTSASSVIAYYYPNSTALIKKMHERGIIIADGQGSLLNNIFRIGNLGSMTLEKMIWVLDNLEECL